MGVTLDLRIIDHEGIVVRGLRAVNEAIRADDPDILRAHLATLPVEIDEERADVHSRRAAMLRELDAPPIIIENEERFIAMAKGDAYRTEALAAASFDELQGLLRRWCWMPRTYPLDKLWDELDWFLQPVKGVDSCVIIVDRPRVGDPRQTVFDHAMSGTIRYPLDDQGDPDCSGYNPPDVVPAILAALEAVSTDEWDKNVPFRCSLHRIHTPQRSETEIHERVTDELAQAREAFEILRAAYSKACERGFGVSCEYSL